MPRMSVHHDRRASTGLIAAWLIAICAVGHEAIAASADRPAVKTLRRAVQLGPAKPLTLDPRGVALLTQAGPTVNPLAASRPMDFRPLGPVDPIARNRASARVESSHRIERPEGPWLRRAPGALALTLALALASALFGGAALLAGRRRRFAGR